MVTLRRLRTIVLLNIAAGVAGCLLSISVYRANTAQIVANFERSLITAFFVVTPVVLLLARFGMRMYRVGVPWNWMLIVTGILGCTIAGTLACSAVSIALGLVPQGHLWIIFWARIQFAAVLALSMGIGALSYGAVRNQLEATMLEQERARKLAVEARLASLESHVRPHFLFNTLNTISSLIPEDPKRAETLVGKLAALLRLSLDSNQARLGSLERELKIIGDYLEIERARYGERLRFRIDVPPELRPVQVPALSLQTLVENSVKHAVGSRFEGAEVRVVAFERDGSVFVEVSDDGPGFTEQAILPGHGLDNLQQRLVTMFGPGARLEIRGGPTVSFCVPRG
uniref:Signal transduction histidine kinase, LytS n=1 Tax=Solibacter usitatus (strain Ellin6076) TaxID=234267 RepID=Q025M0_SOLUE